MLYKGKIECSLYQTNHQVPETCITNFSLRTNQNLASPTIKRDINHKCYQNEGETENKIARLAPNIGEKESPLWTFAPTIRNVQPELHVLLGIGNKIQDIFFGICT